MLTAHSLKERLIKGGIWAVAGRVVGVATGLAVNVLLARLLTPEEMGAYFLTISVVTVIATIAQFGLPSTVVRLAAEAVGKGQGGRARSVISLSIVLCGLFSVIVASVFYYGVGHWLAEVIFKSESMDKIVSVAAVLIFMVALQGLLAEVFRGLHDIRFATLFGGVTTPLFSAIAFGVIWMLQGHSDLRQVLLLSLGAWVLSFFLSSFVLQSKYRLLHGEGAIDIKSLTTVSAPMCVIALVIFTATQGDLWVVGAFLSERDVAVYGAVIRLVVVMTITHSLVVAVVQSTIAEMYGQGDRIRMQRLIQGAALAACLPALAMLIIFMLFGDTLLAVLFGDFYKGGYWPLLILGAGQFIGMLFGTADMVLMMTGYQGHLMKLMLLITVLSFFLAIWLVTIYGLIGVAIAWSAGAIVHGAGTWFLAKKKLNIKCHASLVSMGELKGTR